VTSCDSEAHCITCSDAAVSMRVRRLDAASGLAECIGEDGSASEVDLTLIDGAREGDTVLVHAGVALAHGRPDGAVPISRGRMPRGGNPP
jgi:hydrogenase maturation factor